ncbi:hypothetical protein Btru_074835 [Bulinus truncatus]|nr:hypothetical protein Btru_074835 [Bulinus truncatus]
MEPKSNLRSLTSTSVPSNLSSPGAGWAGSPVRLTSDLSYMHRPPRIMPNYGKKYKEAMRLKTKLPRVLLYDNVTEQTVLEVQLSGIGSQRLKAKRELELQKKSFILRKQFKDRALKKLTKVYHGQDYEHFQQEQSGYVSEGNEGAREDGQCLKSSTAGSLPDIRVTNKIVGVGIVTGKKTGKKIANRRCNSDNALLRKSSDISVIIADGAVTELPPIDDSFLLHAGAVESKDEHELSPHRRVGFSYEKGNDGLTRIFHTMSRGNSDVTHDAINAISDANRPETDAGKLGIDTGAEGDPTSAANKSSIPDADESARTGEKSFNLSQPLLDYRFELLQKVLIRQDPPNEGFLELSPSFQRPAPLNTTASHRRKEKRLIEPVEVSHEGRGSKFPHGITPALSGDNSSDSGEEDVKGGRTSHANGAIKHLGAF